ncbi:MAG: VCBS repeat-containing protein, partial [Blastocatellia bacterium]
PLADAAYMLLSARVFANRTAFYVYRNADSGFNHGFASGVFGDINRIHLNAACLDDPSIGGCSTDMNRLDQTHGNVLSISFDPLPAGHFAGVNFEEPENNGANPRGAGYDLRDASSVVFDIRSPTPGGIKVQFGVGGRVTSFFQIPQSSQYTTMTIPLSTLIPSPPDLSNVHLLFSVATNDVNAPSGGTVLLDNVRFEAVPATQQNRVSFPLANETFGVVPRTSLAAGRVPIPPDQLLGNLTTIYESSLTLQALLKRGTGEDLEGARSIAEALAYAVAHDNNGDPLPPAPDGSRGLHNGNENGDLALFNDQGPGAGQQGDVRLAGFTGGTGICGSSGFCLVLDGATGGNNAFAILSLISAFRAFNEVRYLDAARTIARWIDGNLIDVSGTGYGGYYLGYPDEGIVPKTLIKSKSVENNADIFAAFSALGDIERALGNSSEGGLWQNRANIAGDFVMMMFDSTAGRFYAGVVPVGTQPGPGISPDPSKTQGNDVINTFDFLDSNSFTTLALAGAPRYRNQIDWRRPVQYVLGHFAQTITVGPQTFHGFNIVENPTAGPNGIAWEFTGQAVVLLRFVARLYKELSFETSALFYLNQIRQARLSAPFTDARGLVASTLQNGDLLPPIEQCLSTPFQCIAERVGLAATTWALFAEQNQNVLAGSVKTQFDFDGDRRADLAAWRTSNGAWHIVDSSNGAPSFMSWGVSSDVIAPADYDGDLKTDIGVWRPSTGTWYLVNSSNGSVTVTGWGMGGDVAVPADYDGDGKDDIAVWRPSTGVWYIINSSNSSITTMTWGTGGDQPVAADYDGDSKADLAVWRPSSGVWHIIESSTGSVRTTGWGTSGDKIVPADYDVDSKADIAVWRPSSGT